MDKFERCIVSASLRETPPSLVLLLSRQRQAVSYLTDGFSAWPPNKYYNSPQEKKLRPVDRCQFFAEFCFSARFFRQPHSQPHAAVAWKVLFQLYEEGSRLSCASFQLYEEEE